MRPHGMEDFYTGLAEVLGRERAETLMAYLPTFEPIDVATRSDIAKLRSEIDRLRVELRGEISSRFTTVEERLDRLFLALVGGLFVIVAAMVGLVVAAL